MLYNCSRTTVNGWDLSSWDTYQVIVSIFSIYSGSLDLAISYGMTDLLRTDQISGLFLLLVILKLHLAALVHQCSKWVRHLLPTLCLCANPAVATTKDPRQMLVTNEEN